MKHVDMHLIYTKVYIFGVGGWGGRHLRQNHPKDKTKKFKTSTRIKYARTRKHTCVPQDFSVDIPLSEMVNWHQTVALFSPFTHPSHPAWSSSNCEQCDLASTHSPPWVLDPWSRYPAKLALRCTCFKVCCGHGGLMADSHEFRYSLVLKPW